MRLLRLLCTARLRIRSLFRRDQVEQELEDDFRDHLERRIETEVARGMPADEARYAALRALGGIEQRKEECRDMRGQSSSTSCGRTSATRAGCCVGTQTSQRPWC